MTNFDPERKKRTKNNYKYSPFKRDKMENVKEKMQKLKNMKNRK